jgi:hypothetical protein
MSPVCGWSAVHEAPSPDLLFISCVHGNEASASGDDSPSCPGHHPRPFPGASELDWYRVWAGEPARSIAHTCDRCLAISYELFGLGGAFLIRRTIRVSRGASLHETPRVRRAVAEAWWHAILLGTAR